LLWTWPDSFKLVRLQGKFPFEAIYDQKLNAIFLAWEVLQDGYGAGFWSECKRCTPVHGPGFSDFTRWREISERPQDTEEAWAVLRAAADKEIARLEELLAVHDEIGDGLAERAAVEASASFKRLQRFRSAKSKELRETLDTLLELKKGSSGKSVLSPSDSAIVGCAEDFLRHDSGVRWSLTRSSNQRVL
jgi:hypothetical protein